jgi:gliding motility-associated-like protein
MRKKNHIVFVVLLLWLTLSHRGFSQILFHQDVFHGGVTVAGYSGGEGGVGNGIVEIHLEPNSTIKKVWLFTYTIGFPSPSFFTINNETIFHSNFIFLNEVEHTGMTPVRLYYYDFSDHITPTTTSFSVMIHPWSSGPEWNWGWHCPTIYVEYENPDLDKIATSLWYNDKDLFGFEEYSFQNMLPMDTDNSIGLSLVLDRACFNPIDRTFVHINSTQLTSWTNGVGGNNLNSTSSCAGVRGHFYYQNSTLFGLDASQPNPTMDNNDALADISSYLTNGDTGYELELRHYQWPNVGGIWPNIATIFPHAYTTPCDTFSTQVLFRDTTICRRDTIQLGVSGGNNYYWTNPNNMSGEQTANPLVWPDSTTLYVVRIEDEPGCTRTEHVLVRVNELPQITNLAITPTVCGEETGNIVVSVEGESPFVYSIGSGNQGSAQFSGLAAGTYPLTVTDQNGCTTDTLVVIEEEINVVAQFSATPPTGAEPLDVSFLNNSQNANNFEWYIDNDFWDNSFNTSALFDSSGVYQVMLIAYNNQPHCADTAWFTVIVQDTLVVRIPNIFTPNNDGVNDVFTIDIRGAIHLSATVQNRWGNEMMQLEQTLTPNEQTVPIWNGFSQTTEPASPGVYFYHLEITDTKEEVHVFSGFVHLVR